MINFVSGNILNGTEDILVNTVNCFGTMGKGLALQVRKAYPEIMYEYKIACRKRKIKPGGILMLKGYDGTIILNAATKNHWKHNSRYEWVELCIKNIREFLLGPMGIGKSIAIPPLGCGCGNLSFDKVKQIMMENLSDLPNTINIYTKKS